jgi:hypothetical protein
MTDNYDDIINHLHHVSTHRQPMSMTARAAQFAPFAALTGYEDSLHETEKEIMSEHLLHEE